MIYAVTRATILGIMNVGFCYIAKPIIISAINLVSAIHQGYRSGGILGALDTGTDAVAELCPGGHTIMRSLEQQERAVQLLMTKQKNHEMRGNQATSSDNTVTCSINNNVSTTCPYKKKQRYWFEIWRKWDLTYSKKENKGHMFYMQDSDEQQLVTAATSTSNRRGH